MIDWLVELTTQFVSDESSVVLNSSQYNAPARLLPTVPVDAEIGNVAHNSKRLAHNALSRNRCTQARFFY